MSRILRIVERARADTDDIFNWIANRSVQGAVSWYLEFRQAVNRIAETPEQFGEAYEADRLGRPLREALFKTRRGRIYRIVFECDDTEILILRVRGPGQSRLRRRDLSES
jgi:plasmid stabilization system protein ParE